MLDKKLLKAALPRMKGVKVADVRVGIGYSLLKNSNGGVGLAYTLRNRLGHGCSQFAQAGKVIGKDLAEVANMFTGQGVINAALGLAAINSVTPETDSSAVVKGDVMEELEVTSKDWVTMIGHFVPVEKRLRKMTNHIFIIEDNPIKFQKDMYKIFDEILASTDVVIITATTLINKTLGKVLEKTPNARKKIILGPSTPLYPEVFEGAVDMLSGMKVEDSDKVIDIISQGGGTMHFKKYSKKVNLMLNGKK